ncbi:transcription factor bHLH110-like [Curcuma longa]|uniref:transcription factor bHLH110-like n=1 Tax=Curcuma longa TaxID=136217 RepID=UPI003D9F5855
MGFPHLDHHCHEELRGLPYLATAPAAFYDLANNEILNWGDTLSNAYGRELLLSSHGDWSLNHEAPSPISSQLIQEIGFQWPANKEQLLQEEHQLIILENVKEELLGLRPLPPTNLSESSSFDAYGCMAALATPALLEPPSTSLDMDLPALQLLPSGFDRHLQESILPGSFFLHQKSLLHALELQSVISGATAENRRCSSSRKPRFEHRSSISPLKIRKEKLGDRIAALQQMVAPFGKTDTASVLMEAIGYIKFLLDQVENLTEKYMRLSGNKRSRTVLQEVTALKGKESFEPKGGLRSRGLCLVPLSCTSYIVSEETD